MIKIFCNICGKEVSTTEEYQKLLAHHNCIEPTTFDVCADCIEKLSEMIKQIKKESR